MSSSAVLFAETDIAVLRRGLGSFDGLVGMTALRDVILEMDFPGKKVSAIRLGTENYPEERAIKYQGMNPVVTLMVEGKPVESLIDTGSGFTFILPKLETYPLAYAPIKDDGLGGMAVGSVAGDREENSQLAGEARLGPVSWKNPPLRRQTSSDMGNIGVQALDRWTLAFDQSQHRVYFLGNDLRRAWPPQAPLAARYRPGFLADVAGAGLRLRVVDPDGAFARAGLKAGDDILTIDREPAGQFLSEKALAAAGQRIIQAERDGKNFEVTVILAAEADRPEKLPRQQ